MKKKIFQTIIATIVGLVIYIVGVASGSYMTAKEFYRDDSSEEELFI